MVPTSVDVWRRFALTRSPKLRHQLASNNDKLALKVAHRWVGRCAEPIEDLAQIARIGLLRAIDRFNLAEGAAFSSFAVPYINGEIMHFLRDHWGHLKIPRSTFEELGKVKRIQKQLRSLGRELPLAECALGMGIDQRRWEWIESATVRRPLLAMDEVGELSAPEPESADNVWLHRAIAKLPSLQRRVLMAKYFENKSDRAIARAYGLELEQVQALVEAGLGQLQAAGGDYACS